MKPTIRDIQEKTNLSLSTISNYLNGKAVREKNRILIEKAVQELDYKVNQFGRSLKTNRSNTIGVLIPALYSAFTVKIVMQIEDMLRKEGYGIIICDSRNNPRTESEGIDFLLDKRVDGIITTPCDLSGKQLERAKEEGIPVVLMDQITSDFDTDAVVINNRNASKLAVKELVNHGHTRIGMVSASPKFYTMRERIEGFREALADHQIAFEEELIPVVDMSVDGGYEGMTRLLSLKERPTAVFCANSEITLGVIKKLYEEDLQIGKDISLIGFDYTDYMEIVRPQLTYIAQPMERIASEVTELLLQGIREPENDRVSVVKLPVTVEYGASVASI